MPRRLYMAYGAATAALTAAPTFIATGTSIKTLIQLKPVALSVPVYWGLELETVPTAAIKCELLTTGTVNATVTAFAAGDIVKAGDSGGSASKLVLATSGSGYNAGAEGTITSTRLLDFKNIVIGESGFWKQVPLDREHTTFDDANYLRLRVTTSVTINVLPFIAWEE